MKFLKREEIYTIVGDETTNWYIQRFIRNHGAKKIRIRKSGEYTVTKFSTNEERVDVYAALRKKFDSVFDVRIGEYIIFVTGKTES